MANSFTTSAETPYPRARRTITHVLFEERCRARMPAVLVLEELGLPAHERTRCKTTGRPHLPRLLPFREAGEHDVLLDFGPGAGQAVLQTAGHRCEEEVGAELSTGLGQITRQVRRTPPPAEWSRPDATTMHVPEPEDPRAASNEVLAGRGRS